MKQFARWTFERPPFKAKKGLAIGAIRLLTFILTLSIALPEARLGSQGLVYPQPFWNVGMVGLPFLFEIIIILISIVFLFGLATREISLEPKWSTKMFCWMSIFVAFSIPLSAWLDLEQRGAAFGQMRMTFESLAIFLVASHIPWDLKDLRRIVSLVILAAGFNGSIILLSYLDPEIVPLPVLVLPGQLYARYGGIFSQPARASLLLTVGLASLLTLITQNRMASLWSLLARVGGLLLCVLLVAALLLAQTRASYLAVAMIVVMLATERGRKVTGWRVGRIVVLCLIIGTIFLAVLPDDTVAIGLSRVGPQGALEDEVALYRGNIWLLSLELMLHYPLGVGFDTTWALVGFPHAHNQFLQWGVMFGIPALFILLYFIYRLYHELSTGIEKSDSFKGAMLYAVRLTITAYLISSLFEPFFVTPVGFWFWLMAGIGVAPHLCQTDSEVPLSLWASN